MNSKALWTIGGVIVLIIAAFLLMRGNDGENNTTEDQAGTQQTAGSSEQASFKSLLASNKSQKCTFESAEQGATTKGTVYVSGGKMRGDFTVMSAGQTMSSHMITDTQEMHTWMDSSGTGYKMKFDAQQQSNAEAQAQSIDPNDNFNFNCSNWSVDPSMFNLPSNVEFMSMENMMQGSTPPSSGSSGTPNVDARVCAQLTEPSRTQCMDAMKKQY